jgi:hypothetical protein
VLLDPIVGFVTSADPFSVSVVVDPIVDFGNEVIDILGPIGDKARYDETRSFREDKKSSAADSLGDTI